MLMLPKARASLALLALFGGVPVAASPPAPPARQFDRAVALESTAETSANVRIGDLNGDKHLDIVLVTVDLDNTCRLRAANRDLDVRISAALRNRRSG